VVPPGIGSMSRWRSDNEDAGGERTEEDATICGVGFKQ
jgi:hypothetical protein